MVIKHKFKCEICERHSVEHLGMYMERRIRRMLVPFLPHFRESASNNRDILHSRLVPNSWHVR